MNKFWLLLVTVAALMAGMPPASHAEVFLTGEQISHNGSAKHVLSTNKKLSVSCTVAAFQGTINESHDAATLTPSYGGCTAKIDDVTLPATITMNGCDYFFQVGEEGEEEGHFPSSTASLVCPESKKTEVDVYLGEAKHKEGVPMCVFKVSPFTAKPGATFTNTEGSPSDVSLTTSLEGLEVERNGSIACGATIQTATFTGATTLKGYSDEAHSEQVKLAVG